MEAIERFLADSDRQPLHARPDAAADDARWLRAGARCGSDAVVDPACGQRCDQRQRREETCEAFPWVPFRGSAGLGDNVDAQVRREQDGFELVEESPHTSPRRADGLGAVDDVDLACLGGGKVDVER